MNTKQQDPTKNRQAADNGSNGSKYDDQTARERSQQQKRSAFDEGLADNDNEQPSKNTDPEIETPVQNPEKTEKKIPEMKGNKK